MARDIETAARSRKEGVRPTFAANAMPAATWGWLNMNEAQVHIPEGLAQAPGAVRIELSPELARASHDCDGQTFERALDRAAERYASADAMRDGGATAAIETGNLDAPALSAYQEAAAGLQAAYTPARAFKTGMGPQAFAFMRGLAHGATPIVAPERSRGRATVRVVGADGAAAIAAVDVIAGKDAQVELVVALDSPESGAGVVGASVRVFADDGARVSISSCQTLADGYTALDDTGLFLARNARAAIRQTVLGAGASYTGLAADLRGDESRVHLDTSYLGAREQLRDFNYEIVHRGRATESAIDANGVLTGASKKCLRGTIDLAHGCKGSQGSERETVLLADDRVENKTVPVILCDEDDVAGNHGATIGHVRPDQLFYLACRGISREAAEELFIRAKLEDAAIGAPDDATRASVMRLGGRLFDGFEETLGKEPA